MKNLIVIILSISALTGACYQKSSKNETKPARTVETTSTVAETNSAPVAPTTKAGDYNAAKGFYDAKNYDKAAAEFEKVTEADSKNHQAHFYLGKSRQALNKTDEAAAAFQKAIDVKPEYAEANYELGSIYLGKKDYEKSLPYLEKAAKINYTNVEYLLALGDNYRELKRCRYAVVPYGKVSGFDDKNTRAYYGMGLCYIELENRIAAGQQVRNLEKLDKDLAKKLADQIPK